MFYVVCAGVIAWCFSMIWMHTELELLRTEIAILKQWNELKGRDK